jgi:K+-sensing histidine kinase KdpD
MENLKQLLKLNEENFKDSQITLKKEEVLCRQGDDPECVYIFISGRLDIFSNGIRVAAITEKYTPVCELSYFLKIPHTATVIAAQSSQVYRIDNSKIDDLFASSPVIIRSMLVNLMKGFVSKEEKYVSIMKNQEAKIAERTEELKELNEFKTSMVGMVAHDLRNPLCAMKGYLEAVIYLHGKVLHEDVKSYIMKSIGIADNMNHMIVNILDASLIENGKINVNNQQCIISDIIDGVIDRFTIHGKQRNIKFQWENTMKDSIVNLDPLRFSQILENLLNNSLKYAPDDSIISIAVSGDVDVLQLTLKDSGPPVFLQKKKLFNHFYRKGEHRESADISTEIGFAIAKKLTELHNGHFSIETVEDHPVITIQIPVKKDT